MRNIPSDHGVVRSPDLAVWLRETAPDNAEQLRFLRRSLQRAIREELTPKQAQYVTMYYIQGLSTPEIARTLGIHNSTASRTLTRARARLRHVLSYSLEFPPDGF